MAMRMMPPEAMLVELLMPQALEQEGWPHRRLLLLQKKEGSPGVWVSLLLLRLVKCREVHVS